MGLSSQIASIFGSGDDLPIFNTTQKSFIDRMLPSTTHLSSTIEFVPDLSTSQIAGFTRNLLSFSQYGPVRGDIIQGIFTKAYVKLDYKLVKRARDSIQGRFADVKMS